MSGTGTSSRTRACPYSCMRAAFMSASFCVGEMVFTAPIAHFVYTAVVRGDREELTKSKEVELYPGMAATVMIETKVRTALDYLLGPVVASFVQSSGKN